MARANTLSNLPHGTYRIEVEKKLGFEKFFRPNVILHVQDALGNLVTELDQRRSDRPDPTLTTVW